jgi:hypothetical protein
VLSGTGFSQIHNIRGVATTVVVTRYRALPESLAITTRTARPARLLRSRTRGRLYSGDALLERLAQACQHVACALGPFIQQEHAVVRPRPVPRHRHLAAAAQPHIRDGVMGGATGARGDRGGAGAGTAGDARGAGGVEGFSEGHLRQDGGEPPRQHRLARLMGAERQDIMIKTLGSSFNSRLYPVELAASRDELPGCGSAPHRLASRTLGLFCEVPGRGMAPRKSHLWDRCLFTSNPSHSQDLSISRMGPLYNRRIAMKSSPRDLILEMGSYAPSASELTHA